MGEDYFFGTSPSQSTPQPAGVPGQPPSSGPGPGMPGYSWQQHEQVRAQVQADAPPAVPMSGATVVACAAVLGAILMLVGSWAPWVKASVTFNAYSGSESVGGLHSGLDGRYVLAVGILALLTAATALTSQQTPQVRHICAAVLVGAGVVGLGIVVHDWTTVSDRFRAANDFLNSFGSQLGAGGSGTNPFAEIGFSGFQIHKGWGLTLSGVASSITGLAGAYLFLVKQP